MWGVALWGPAPASSVPTGQFSGLALGMHFLQSEGLTQYPRVSSEPTGWLYVFLSFLLTFALQSAVKHSLPSFKPVFLTSLFLYYPQGSPQVFKASNLAVGWPRILADAVGPLKPFPASEGLNTV